MKTRAAIAFEKAKPLEIVELDLDGPKDGEVLVEIKATGICHTDEFTLSGADPEGLFPTILGHEGAGIVVKWASGVTSLKQGDHIIPLYTPECRECEYCLNPKTNLCQKIRGTQGKGLMPDGTSRFSYKGKIGAPLHGVFHLLQFHGDARNRPGESPRGRTFRQDLLHRVWRDDGCGGGHQHSKGGSRLNGHCVRSRRHRSQCNSGSEASRRQHDRRRRPQSGARSLGQALRHDALRQSLQGQRRPRRPSRRTYRRRSRLHLRMHRQRQGDAGGPRGLPTRAGASRSSSALRAQARKSRRVHSSS